MSEFNPQRFKPEVVEGPATSLFAETSTNMGFNEKRRASRQAHADAALARPIEGKIALQRQERQVEW